MLFKISDEKLDKSVDLEENGQTFPRKHVHFQPLLKEPRSSSGTERWWWLKAILIAIILAVVLSALPFLLLRWVYGPNWVEVIRAKNDMSRHKLHNFVEKSFCVLNHRKGSCMAQEYCCEGEYAISQGMCSTNQVCCIGTVKKCKDKKNPNFWSFESLTRISSKIMFRNVSESVVEQAIVTSVSALEKRTYYHEMSDNIGTDMTALTGQKWFSIVGNKDSFDLNLSQFSAYILISINEMEILLIRVDNNASPFQSTDYELNESVEIQSDLSSENGHDYELDTRPTFEIIRNDMNESMRDFVIQTIDFLLNICPNDYHCFAPKMVSALKQQFQSTGTAEWQTIITSNTVVEQMVVDVDYLHGSLLDGIFNNKHRILIYIAASNTKLTEEEIIKSGRKALALNKTIIYENSFEVKANVSQTLVIEDIRRAVMSNNKLLSICRDLTSVSTKHMQSWGCVAGPQNSFAYSIRREFSKHFLVVKLNQLLIILFKKTCNKGFRM